MKKSLLSIFTLSLFCYAVQQDPAGLQLPADTKDAFAIIIQQKRAEFERKKERANKNSCKKTIAGIALFCAGLPIGIGGGAYGGTLIYDHPNAGLSIMLSTLLSGFAMVGAGAWLLKSEELKSRDLSDEEEKIRATKRTYKKS